MKNSRAVVEERRNNIIKILGDNTKHNVENLAQELGYSPITIRRDLLVLEENGMVKRQYGSVQLVDTLLKNDDTNIYDLARKKIAERAASMVEDDDTIFINTGRTTQAMLAALKGKKNVTVVTNNLMALDIPVDNGINLMLVGGEVAYPGLSGEFSINSLRQVIASKCFIGVNGISAEAGMTTALSKFSSINSEMLARCNGERVVIADSSKIGRRLNFYSGDISQISRIITDNLGDPEELDKLRARDIIVDVIDMSNL